MSSEAPFVHAAYGPPGAFWETGARLDEYGIDALIVHSELIDAALLAKARSQGAKVYAAFATLNGRDYVDKHAEAWPVDERGDRSPAASWFMGACPTEPRFRAQRMQTLEVLLGRNELDGVFLGYHHWHAQFEDPRPVLPETCFSATCVRDFSSQTGLNVPNGSTAEQARWILKEHDREWRDWRCSVLGEWVQEIRVIIHAQQAGIPLGLFLCPWRDEEFGGARRRILGLDLELLAPLVDVMSPMLYDGRMGRSPQWVGESVRWLSQRVGTTKPRIWPIVQAGEFRPEFARQRYSADEFAEVMRQGRSNGASGLSMFALEWVAADPAKMAVLRDLYAT